MSDPKYSKDPIKIPRKYAVTAFLEALEFHASHNDVIFPFNAVPKVSIPKVVTNDRISPASADDSGFTAISTAAAVKKRSYRIALSSKCKRSP